MSKIPDKILLIPGESGWEIWTGQPETGFTLLRKTDAQDAADITDLPSGEITLFFPVKSIIAVPMRVSSDDESLFEDLASLHAERLGLRPDPMSGQLTDTFTISKDAENSTLLNIHLRSPKAQDLPKRGPKSFDISPRAFSLSGDQIAIWKEFGRWAYSIFHQGQLIYSQLTSSSHTSPDETLAREIRLALTQLSLQGIEVSPAKIHFWTSENNVSTTELSRILNLTIDQSSRPTPVLPTPLSKLLPADVGAARLKAKRRSQLILGGALLAAVYLGTIGWLGFSLWKTQSETKKLTTEATEIAPESAAYADYIQKWDELADAIQLENSPVDILYRISRSIPLNSGLRLKTADVSAAEITLTGEGPQLESVKKFSLNLNNSNDLATFVWETPEPTNRERGWEFIYKGAPANLQP